MPLPGAQIQVFKVGIVGPPTFWLLRRMAKVAHVPFDGVHLSWRRRFQVERAQLFGVEEMVLGIIYIMYIYIYPYHEVESNLANIMSDHMIYNTEWELLFRAIEVCHARVNAMMNI